MNPNGQIGEIQAPADEPVFCDWNALGEPDCQVQIDPFGITDLCTLHERIAAEENEAELSRKRGKEWT